MDTEHQAGLKGLEAAAAKGLGVIIMEPLQGGRLANLPEDIRAMLNKAPVQRTPVEWALRFLADRKEVSTVLSGMSLMEHVTDNLRICSQEDMKIGCMTTEEKQLLQEVSDYWHSRINIGCTACRYCMPCPSGVDIPGVFAAWNLHASATPGSVQKARRLYKELIEKNADASHCVECGACEIACPQHLSIIADLKRARAALE